jgi:hypothetical protein
MLESLNHLIQHTQNNTHGISWQIKEKLSMAWLHFKKKMYTTNWKDTETAGRNEMIFRGMLQDIKKDQSNT